mmetsp:Transcript_96641/g.181718  ORF Transcript_96641/g.181718 Transcript_96641/m.181718 type:complete len:253 (-) Transcript_96641:73-831(-)
MEVQMTPPPLMQTLAQLVYDDAMSTLAVMEGPAANRKDESVEIIARKLDGSTVSVEARVSESVGDLRKKLHQKLGLQSQCLSLAIGQHLLRQDSLSLRYLGIECGAVEVSAIVNQALVIRGHAYTQNDGYHATTGVLGLFHGGPSFHIKLNSSLQLCDQLSDLIPQKHHMLRSFPQELFVVPRRASGQRLPSSIANVADLGGMPLPWSSTAAEVFGDMEMDVVVVYRLPPEVVLEQDGWATTTFSKAARAGG